MGRQGKGEVNRSNFQNKKPFSKKPPRPMSVRYLELEMDALTSLIVRAQEKVCFIIGCDKTVGLECGHLFERRHRATRWDIAPDGNNHSQCPKHNAQHEAEPTLYQDSYIQRFSERAFDDLATRARSNVKITYIELVETYERLKTELQRLRVAA